MTGIPPTTWAEEGIGAIVTAEELLVELAKQKAGGVADAG